MNENIESTTTETEDEFDLSGWDEEPVESVEEETEAEPETAPETETEAGDGENQPEPEQAEAEPEKPAEEPATESGDSDSFELKYMGETKRVGKQEAIVLAQKGLDYDRIRGERDSMSKELEGLRADKGRLTDYESFLDKLARSVGQDIPTMIDTTMAKMLVAEEAKKGNKITEDFALQKIQFDREKAAFAKQQGNAEKKPAEPEKPEEKKEEKPADDEETAKARRNDEANAFLKAYPDVDPKSIPKEVMDKWRAGVPLLQAYTMYENQKLKAELAALEQNNKNSARSAGSAKSAGAGRTADPFFAGWDD